MNELLKEFIEKHNQLNQALIELRKNTKEQVSSTIQELIKNENFKEAESVIKELDQFTKISFNSNIQEITLAAENIFKNEKIVEYKNSNKEIVNNYLEKEKKEEMSLTDKEKEIIKIIGKTGISRMKDFEVEIDKNDIKSLYDKKMLTIKDDKFGDLYTSTVLLLNENSKKIYKELKNEEPNIPTFMKENGEENFAEYFIIKDIIQDLKNRDYTIVSKNGMDLEVEKNGRTLYLTLVGNTLKPKEGFDLMEEKAKMKNIGFIFVNEEEMNKMRKEVEIWAEEKEYSTRYLTVNLSTIEKLSKAEIFEIKKF